MNGKQNRSKVDKVFILLLILTAAVRIYGAYVYQFSRNLDYHTVVLMARHMAEGTELPVFFYGQAYMGSFEPMVSAVFARLFDNSMFAICMGTAVFGIFLAPIIYLWAKDIAGRSAGYAAMLVLMIGPHGFFHYTASPRGGYSLTLFLGTFILWFASRIISREKEGESPWAFDYLLLGLAAGLGIWSNFLIVTAVITAGIMFVVFLGPRILHRHLITGVIGTLISSAPLWMWNLQHQWKSLDMGADIGKAGFLKAMGFFWGKRMVEALTSAGQAGFIKTALVGLLGLTVICFVAMWIRSFRSSDCALPARVGMTMLMVFIPVNALIFSLSSFSNFNTSRYHLPLLPALAVITGIVVSKLLIGKAGKVAWLLPVFIAAMHTPVLSQMYTQYQEDCESWEFGVELKAAMDGMDVEALYAHRVYRWSGVAMDEAYAVSAIDEEPYYAKRYQAEHANAYAVLNNYGFFVDFVDTAGGSMEEQVVGKQKVYYDIQSPKDPGRVIPLDAITRMVDNIGKDRKKTLTDADLATQWIHDETERVKTLEIHFDEPRDIMGIRALHSGEFLPERWWITGLKPDGRWVPVIPKQNISEHFWSGPRSYYSGIHQRLETRFRSSTYSALKLRFQSDRMPEFWSFTEIYPLELGGQTETRQDLLDLYEDLRGLDVSRLYADRWTANGIHDLSAGDIWTSREPDIYREDGIDVTLSLTPDTAIAVKQQDAFMTSRALASRGVNTITRDVGLYRVFYFDETVWEGAYRALDYLAWSGVGVTTHHSKLWSMQLLQQARAIRKKAPHEAEAMLTQAMEVYPNNREAVLQLADWSDEAATLSRLADKMWTPEISARVAFEDGVTLLGLDPPTQLSAEGRFHLNLYWQCPEDVDKQQLAVFVHLHSKGETHAFDHVLLQRHAILPQLENEVFVENVVIQLAEGVTLDSPEITLGIYNRAPGSRRLKARTKLPSSRNAVTLPVTLRRP